MVKVQLVGWKTGLAKIRLTRLIQSTAGVGIGEAKAKVDALLEGSVVVIAFSSNDAAHAFAEHAHKLGALTEIADE